MASGSITLTRNGSGLLDGRILWESTSNGSTANTSTVNARLQLMRNASRETTSGTFRGTFTVGDQTYNIGKFYDLPHGKWITIRDVEVTVSHSADGSGVCYLYANINGPTGTTMEGTSVSGSKTVDLDKIPRFATILSATDFTDEENPTITYSNPLGSAIHTLEACISVTGQSADIPYRSIDKSDNSYTFALTTEERTKLRKAAESSNTITLKFVVRSRISKDGESDTDNVKATMTVVNANPVVEFSVRDTNETTLALTGDERRIVAYHSVAEVNITATPQKDATIPNNGVKITDGATVWYKGATFTGVISPIASGNITYEVTDSRGNRSGGGGNSTFVEYFNPEVEISNVTRGANGNLMLTVIGRAFKGSFGKESNNVGVYYRYRESDGGTLTAWAALSNSEITWNGNEFTAEKTISGLDYSKNYNVHVSITDVFHAGDKRIIVREEQLPTLPVFDWGADSFNFHVPVYDQTGSQIGNSSQKWQNPPMVAGTEYLTTQRHQNKEVYTKLISFGDLPGSGNKRLASNIPTTATIVSFQAFARNKSSGVLQQMPLISTTGGVLSKVQVMSGEAAVYVFSDLSAYEGYVMINYTK